MEGLVCRSCGQARLSKYLDPLKPYFGKLAAKFLEKSFGENPNVYIFRGNRVANNWIWIWIWIWKMDVQCADPLEYCDTLIRPTRAARLDVYDGSVRICQ